MDLDSIKKMVKDMQTIEDTGIKGRFRGDEITVKIAVLAELVRKHMVKK